MSRHWATCQVLACAFEQNVRFMSGLKYCVHRDEHRILHKPNRSCDHVWHIPPKSVLIFFPLSIASNAKNSLKSWFNNLCLAYENAGFYSYKNELLLVSTSTNVLLWGCPGKTFKECLGICNVFPSATLVT